MSKEKDTQEQFLKAKKKVSVSYGRWRTV